MESLGAPSEFTESAELSLARFHVELVRDAGSIRPFFGIEYEGADWEVVVRIRPTEDGDPPSSRDREVTEQFPD